VTLGDQARQQAAADPAGRPGEQQLHGRLLLVPAGFPAGDPRVGRGAAAREGAPIQGLAVPGWPVRVRHDGDVDRAELAAFLRTRRARLGPGDVGLPTAARRRTPGLRREEVALLAGVSVDYYTRLEQARGPHPSRQVLAALARALRLTGDERTTCSASPGSQPPNPRRAPSTSGRACSTCWIGWPTAPPWS
jgi:transcriptional regulator with XRE-family HTH domain